MKKMRALLKRGFTSVTIMVIPHDSIKAINVKAPLALLIVTLMLALVGGAYTLGLALSGLKYKAMYGATAEKASFYAAQFNQWNATVAALKMVEVRFRRLFSLDSKEEVLENVNTASIGSVEIPKLIANLRKTVETVDEIKSYLHVQKDIYTATPKGFPVTGEISSGYGKRSDPFSGETVFHTGIDISCETKMPIHATADGVVSYSGWMEEAGNIVVLEHGFGFSTVYAHNQKNAVRTGQMIKRGDVIGYVGSTGKATGPHLHYEVWKDGKNMNAEDYLPRRS